MIAASMVSYCSTQSICMVFDVLNTMMTCSKFVATASIMARWVSLRRRSALVRSESSVPALPNTMRAVSEYSLAEAICSAEMFSIGSSSAPSPWT